MRTMFSIFNKKECFNKNQIYGPKEQSLGTNTYQKTNGSSELSSRFYDSTKFLKSEQIYVLQSERNTNAHNGLFTKSREKTKQIF